MYNLKLWSGEKQKGSTELLGKLPGQIEGDAPKVGITQQIIKVVGQQLEDQTQVIPPHEMPFQPHCNEYE